MELLEDIIKNETKYMKQAGGCYEIVGPLCALRSAIKYKKKKIVLYGIGFNGMYIYGWLEKEDINVEFILDKDKKKANSLYKGCPIYTSNSLPMDLRRDIDSYIAIITPLVFRDNPEEILSILKEIGITHYIFPFTHGYGIVPYQSDWVYYYKKNMDRILKIYNGLGDELSKKTYLEYIKSIMINHPYDEPTSITRKKYFECYKSINEEVFLNIGAYSGDTICQFIENRKEVFKQIYAIEGSREIFENELSRCLKIFPENIIKKICSECIWLDEKSIQKFENINFTLINMDIEGAEQKVLAQLVNFTKNRPVFAICAYHRLDDIVVLPECILDNMEDYVIYFRKYPSSYGVKLMTGELVMYAVPIERTI